MEQSFGVLQAAEAAAGTASAASMIADAIVALNIVNPFVSWWRSVRPAPRHEGWEFACRPALIVQPRRTTEGQHTRHDQHAQERGKRC